MHTTEPEVPVLDDAVLADLETLGPDVVGEIVELFLLDVPGRLATLQRALDDRRGETVHREAHGLKGSALSIGATRLAAVCAAIEHAARQGDLDQAAAHSPGLISEFEEVQEALKKIRR